MAEDGGIPGDDDPVARLLDPLSQAAAPREPSAEERIRAAERAARQADLQRRLQERERAERDAERQQRKTVRSLHRKGWTRSRIGPLVVLALLAALGWTQVRHRDSASHALSILPTPPTAPRPSNYPPRQDESATPLGTPPPVPDPSGPFEFMYKQKVGAGPVAWDPCRPVRYVMNLAGAPPGGEALLREAIARTAAATGLHFEDAGTTDEPWSKDREPYQPQRYGETWAPALLSWGTAATVPALAGYVEGLAGGTPRSAPDGRAAFVSGQLVLDAEDLGALMQTPGGNDAARGIMQHELGHLVGLDHVADPTQLMYTEGNPSQTNDWSSGDLAGLHHLGTGACLPDL